jgi:hypothetical protein
VVAPTPRGWKVVHSSSLGIERSDFSADTVANDPMATRQPTEDEMRDVHVSDIQQRMMRGEYHVDTQAVAAAILRRVLSGTGLGAADVDPQEPCS